MLNQENRRKFLPLWKQSFIVIRELKDTVYIDKTEYILNMINGWKNTPYFLSRPRRFGKSLLIDTIRCLFEWRKELFEDLYIYDKWDWTDKYPVIKIAFWDDFYKNTTVLQNTLNWILEEYSDKYQIKLKKINIWDRFFELIRLISEKTGKQVVVLIDEYDKPILDKIEEPEIANELKDELKWFYSSLKWADEYLKFVMLCWVTKFSKVSIFSGLNNLTDITLDPKYNEICWYTIDEIKENFWPEWYLEWLDYVKMKDWYNGYSFWWETKLYNPFWLLHFFNREQRYSNYWFETATPTFLIKLLKKNYYPIMSFENLSAWEEITSSFEVDNLNLTTLMFQSWYLTIKSIENFWWEITYKLWVPNKEVRKSLNDYIIKNYIWLNDSRKNMEWLKWIYYSVEAWDVDWFIEVIKSLYSSIPYTNYINNPINEYEWFYASVFYAFMTGIGIDFIAEDFTNYGRIDFTVEYKEYIFIIEFKVEKTWKKALEQIKERKYYEKYLSKNKNIILLWIDFNEEKKNIESYEFEKMM